MRVQCLCQSFVLYLTGDRAGPAAFTQPVYVGPHTVPEATCLNPCLKYFETAQVPVSTGAVGCRAGKVLESRELGIRPQISSWWNGLGL